MSHIIPEGSGTIDVRVERTGATTTYQWIASCIDGGVLCSGMAQFRAGRVRCGERVCSCGACERHAVIAEHFEPGAHCACIEHVGPGCLRCD